MLDKVTGEVAQAFAPPDPAAVPVGVTARAGRDLRRSSNCPANTVLLARSAGEITGTMTLVMFPLPTGLRAWIEDVVVDESARGQGTGEAMMQEAIRLAREAGAKTVDLTSRPAREAAGRLYERLGFTIRESRLYRYQLQD